jgi:hypothetical protein
LRFGPTQGENLSFNDFNDFINNFIVRLGGVKLVVSTKKLILLSNIRKTKKVFSLVRITTD